MAVTTIIAPQIVPAGTIGPSAPQAIASAPRVRTVVLQIISPDWTTNEAGLEIDLIVDVSTDGGATWPTQVRGHATGGNVNSRNGMLPNVGVTVPANTAIHLRGTAVLNKQANSLGLGYEIFG